MASVLPFSLQWYLSQNPDVADAVSKGLVDAFQHYETLGKAEGRSANPLFNPAEYLNSNPDVAAAVARGDTTAYDHFVAFGASEGRTPLALFDEVFYLLQNPDVAQAVGAGAMTAVQHFLLYGQNEPRPFNASIDLGDYLQANPDVAQAVEAGFMSAMGHLMLYGANESRDLGNGVNLGDFARDPTFNAALASGNIEAALARVGDVAPFLPGFEKPANWVIPANTPLPTGFVPVEGKNLEVPQGFVLPEGTVLPPSFEPATPGTPPVVPPVTPPGTGGEDPGPATLLVDDAGGVITFSGSATGDITVSLNSGSAIFTRGTATATIQDLGSKKINLSVDQSLQLTPEQVTAQAITTIGLGKVKVVYNNGDNAVLTGNADTNIGHLGLELNGSSVALPVNVDTNVLVYPTSTPLLPAFKSLSVQASGQSSLDLGNLPSAKIGYFLKNVTVVGGEAGDTLALKTLYFASEGTVFDSTAYKGGVTLDAYVYNGKATQYNWSITFGSGNDSLRLYKDGNGNYPGKHGSVIDGGGGGVGETNTLILGKDLYTDWAQPDETYTKPGTVKNFQVLSTEVVTGRAYKAELLENKFDTLKLTGGIGTIANTSATDFKIIDVSAVTGNLTITAGEGDNTIIFGIDTTVRGGGGSDTFVITAPAGADQATKQLSIADYSSGSDVIDLTRIAELTLNGTGSKLEIHQGGKTGGAWGSQAQGTAGDVLVQLSGGSGSQLIVEGAYGSTVAFKITEAQAGLGSSVNAKDFLINISEAGVIDATGYTGGAILSGGGGNQTLISGTGNDIMQGGAGSDTFKFSGDFGIDVILDYAANDKVELAPELVVTLTRSSMMLKQLSNTDAYMSTHHQLTALGLDQDTTITLHEQLNGDAAVANAIILIGDIAFG